MTDRWTYLAIGLAAVGAWAWQRTLSASPGASFVGPINRLGKTEQQPIIDLGPMQPEPWNPWGGNLSLPLNDPARVDAVGNSVIQRPGSPVGLVIPSGAL